MTRSEPSIGEQMGRAANVAVILVNHEDYVQKFLPDCCASLQRQTYPADRVTIFIVNNGLSNDAKALIERVAPHAHLLQNATNLGWGGGNNTALAVALKQDFDYLVMLNVDTVVDREWLARFVAAAEGRQDIHILQSKILLYGTHRINSLGNRIHFLGYGYCNGYNTEDSASPPLETMDYASGAAMLVKREVFQQIGLFREDYFMYYDDTEFCWRARLAGFNVGVADEAVCYHKYEFKNKLGLLYYLERNRLMTLLTLTRTRTILLILPCLLVIQAVFGLYLVARGKGHVVWSLLRYFTRPSTWRMIRARHRAVNSLRVRRDADIVRRFAGCIVFAEVRNPVLRYVVNPLLGIYWAIVRCFIVW